MVKALIFDCWGTIFTNSQVPHPFTTFANRLGYQIGDRAFLKPFERHVMTNNNELAPNITNLLNELGIEPADELVQELVALIVSSTQTQIPFPETIEVLNELKKDYQLVLLSNTFKEGFSSLDGAFNLSKWFDVMILSYNEGTVKPDTRLYQKVLSETGLTADEVLMIGDNYDDDILSANKAGINAVLIDRRGRYPYAATNKISSLKQLSSYL